MSAPVLTTWSLTNPAAEQEFLTGGTFPHSAAGHLRQNRAFIEVDLKHDLKRLLKEGVGPFSLLNDLPFRIKSLGYEFTFRGEGEGLGEATGRGDRLTVAIVPAAREPAFTGTISRARPRTPPEELSTST